VTFVDLVSFEPASYIIIRIVHKILEFLGYRYRILHDFVREFNSYNKIYFVSCGSHDSDVEAQL